jgi:hypothetical protein
MRIVHIADSHLEDEPLLNAGTGSYLQADGVSRMDASIMSSDGRAGAVVQVPGLKNLQLDAEYMRALRREDVPGLPRMEKARFKGEYPFAWQFLYQDNDADRLLFRARFMIALLGVLLGFLLFSWARELFGFWPARSSSGCIARSRIWWRTLDC